jgi:hypothetical protein
MKRSAPGMAFSRADLAYLMGGCVLIGMTLGLLLVPILTP